METSLSEVSKYSSKFARLFDREMKQDFYILKDMVQSPYEDVREGTRLHEKLVAIKLEKEGLLQRMHEIEM